MRIGVSLLNLRPGKMGGIETYMREMTKRMRSVAGCEMIFFANRATCELVPEGETVRLLDWPLWKTSAIRFIEAFTPWRSRTVERMVAEAGIDVIFFTHQAMFPKCVSIPSVMVVADVQHLYLPEYFSWLDLEFRKTIYAKSLVRCSAIAAISQVTADSLVATCGVAPEKIEVVRLGCDRIDPTTVPNSGLVDKAYLYYPAASFRHKGHRKLFGSFAALKRAGRISQKLVLSGLRTGYWKELEDVIVKEGMNGEIIHLGYLPFDKVLGLYKGADAVLFPTEFEGFGIPVLEAVQFEKKLVCSRLPVFDELGVPEQWQIDFGSPAELLRALDTTGPTRLKYELNTWDNTAKQTLDLLKRTALSSKSGG